MKVLVTGASGRLGRRVIEHLHQAGHEPVGVDRRFSHRVECRFEMVDLLDWMAVYRVTEGIDAVVHLANHVHDRYGESQVIYAENVTTNANVMQAAVDRGATKLIFASSIQVLGGQYMRRWERDQDDEPYRADLPYLPLDGELPARPRNAYALSKQAGEQMMAFYAETAQVSAVSLRLPYLLDPQWIRRSRFDMSREAAPSMLDDALSFLTHTDAARLVLAILASDLPGHRTYLPAAAETVLRIPAREAIERYYSHVPLKQPIEQIDALVDVSQIGFDTGWQPQEGLPERSGEKVA